MKKLIFLLVITAALTSFSLSGICPFPGDITLKSSGGIAEFRGGTLVDLAPKSGFDILRNLEIVVNRKKFVPSEWRLSGSSMRVTGAAGRFQVEVLYKWDGKRLDVSVASKDHMSDVRFLVALCDFEPLIVRGMNYHFVQGRHTAYGFELKRSRSFFMGGRFIIMYRNAGKSLTLKIYVDRDLESVKKDMGLSSEEKEFSVIDQYGKPLPGVVVVESSNGKVVSAAQADENGKLEISYKGGASFSLLWGEDYEIEKVSGSKIVVKVPKSGWRWDPYLSGADYNGVWVAFRTWRPTKGMVVYKGRKFSDSVIDTFHNIEVTGMKPGELGKALVKAGNLERYVYLKTLKRKDIKFLVYGDTRTNEDWHEMVCKSMEKENADFIIHTGDLVESGDLKRDWDKFFEAGKYVYFNTPIFPTLGNHERNSPLYYQAFTLRRGGGDFDKRWYSYTVGDIYFIVLDSNVSEGSSVYKSETEWLERELKKAQSYKFIVVYFHHPFFTNSPNREPTLKEEWKKLFEKYRVSVVFNGHIHHYERFLINGVMYVTTGGGGAPLGFGLLSSRRTHIKGTKAGVAGYLHYVVAQVEKGGVKFTVKAVAKYNWGKLDTSVKGKVIDEFFIPFRK